MAIRSNLPAALAEMEALLTAKNEAYAIVIENRAKELAPKDTGRLAASITHDSDASGLIVGTNVPYAVFQELGTSKMSAQPYLVPAVMGTKDEGLRIYNA